MSSQIKSVAEILALPIGTTVYFIENEYLRNARFVGRYPSNATEIAVFADGSMMFQFGAHYFTYANRPVFTDHDEASLNFVKYAQARADGICYVYTPDHEIDHNGTIHPSWINFKVRKPDAEQTVLWAHFPIVDTSMVYASMSQSDFKELIGDLDNDPWYTHWRETTNDFYYIKS